MTGNETKDYITEIIKEECANYGYNIVRMILFGSRASGNYNIDSDWDFS